MASAHKDPLDIPADARLVLITGLEPALRHQALKNLIQTSTSEDDYDYQEFLGDTPPGEWIAAVSTAPFLSEKRTVVVRNLLRAGNPEEAFEGLENAIQSLPEYSRLILFVDDESGNDDKQQRLERIRKKWGTTIASWKGWVSNCDIDANGIKLRIKTTAENAGKKISACGIQKLVEMTGDSLSRALEELEKLILFAGDDVQIRDADIAKLVVASREYKIYNMVRAIFENRPGEALTQLRILVESPNKMGDVAFRAIFPTLRREVKMIWQARAVIESKANVANLPPSLADQLPRQGRIDGEKDWKQANALQTARRHTFKGLAEMLNLIDQADDQMKGGAEGVGDMDVLERMALQMCRCAVLPARN